MKKLCLLAVISIFMLASMVSAQSVAGEWQATMETPGEPSVSKLTLIQNGEKLSGTLKGQRGEAQLEGTIKGKEVKFSYSINYNGNAVPIAIAGLLDGDLIKGTASIAGGSYEGAWMAKRLGGTAAATPAASNAINVTGAWNVEVETSAGSGTPSFTFKQEGEKLMGHYKGQLGEADLTGTVKGGQIEFSYKLTGGQVEGTVVYAGTTDGKTMKGKVSLAGLGEGTFTGKKQ